MVIHDGELKAERPPYLGGGNWKLKNLNEITVLFGKNGSGKSMLLRGLRDADKEKRHYISPERSGNISYNERTVKEENDAVQRSNKRKNNQSASYHQEAVSRIQVLLLRLLQTARQAEKGEINQFLSLIENLVNKLMSDFRFKIDSGKEPPYSLIRIETGEKITSVDQLSSGESQIFTVGLDLLTISGLWELEKSEKRILLIDEPDTHLHPDLQRHFAEFLIELLGGYNTQVIIATHSTTLLSALGFYGGEKTSVIYLNNATSEQDAIKFDDQLRELSMCLGGHALMGPLFNAPLLLVEGDDDYSIWSQVPRHHQVKLAAIPCNGASEVDKYQKTLEKIFASLQVESSGVVGFALKDGDQTLPTTDSVSQNHIKYIKLSCSESENLYLTDEILKDLGYDDWNSAKEKIKAEAGNHGQKEAYLRTCDNWTRKEQDIKSVIKQLQQILDIKNVPWTRRVGQCIGRQKPNGQLADFLGEGVINAMWGP